METEKKALDWNLDDLSSSLASATSSLCDFGHVPSLGSFFMERVKV